MSFTAQQQSQIREHYLSWSGGWEPDSEETIFLYVEYARLLEWDKREVRALLVDWMNQALADEKGTPP